MSTETEVSWRGVNIRVSHKPGYGEGWHHIELRCDTQLPVTETGYRSHFMHEDELALFESVEAFVLEWLETATAEQGGQQLSLF